MVTFKQIPPGMRIVSQVGTELILAKKTHGRRRFKLSKSRRDAISRSARRMKIPVLTLTAVGIPISLAIDKAGGLNKLTTRQGFMQFGDKMLSSYTGFSPLSSTKFDIQRAAVGLGPLIALTLVRRFGIFKGANQGLARAKVPLRLA